MPASIFKILKDKLRSFTGQEIIFGQSIDPTVAGFAAPTGSFLVRNNGFLYAKTGAGNTDWVFMVSDATQFTGDVNGTSAASVVAGIRGQAVSTQTPVEGQVLAYNGTAYVPENQRGNVNLLGSEGLLQNGTANWVEYSNVEAGTLGVGLSLSTITGSPLLPNAANQSFRLSKLPGNVQNAGVALNITIPKAYRNNPVYWSHLVEDIALSQPYVAGNIEFFIYSVDNAVLLDTKGDLNSAVSFLDNGENFRVGYRVATNSTDQQDLRIDKIELTPQSIVDSAIVNEWQPLDVTLVNHTGTNVNFYYKRIGSTAFIKANYSLATIAGNFQFTINSFNLDTVNLPAAAQNRLGTGTAIDIGTGANVSNIVVRQSGTSANLFEFQITDRNATNNGNLVNGTSPFTWVAGDIISIDNLSFPVAEWKDQSAIQSTTAIKNETIKARYVKTASQSFNSNTETQVGYEVQEYNDGAQISSSSTSWQYTARRKEKVTIRAGILLNATSAFSGNEFLRLSALVDGVVKVSLDYQTDFGGSNGFKGVRGSASLDLESGQVVTIGLLQNSLTTTSSLSNGSTDVLYNYVEIESKPSFSVYSVFNDFDVSTVQTSGSQTGQNFWETAGCSLTLEPGTYLVSCNFTLSSNNSSNLMTRAGVRITSADGTGTTLTPPSPQSNANIQRLSGNHIYNLQSTDSSADMRQVTDSVNLLVLEFLATETIYAVPNIIHPTATNGTWDVRLNAIKVQ